MANSNIRPGNGVEERHTSDGPEMLVLTVRGGKALCTWDGDHGQAFCTRWFRLRCLRRTIA